MHFDDRYFPRGAGARPHADPMTPHSDARPLNLVALCSLALFVGIVAGFGAVVFRALIAFIHNLLFLGQISFVYEANLFTPPSPWGPLVILVPIVGGMGVVFLVNNFAPEAKGHGVPEVMDAIFYKEGRIRPVVALVKSLASALSIGSGAAVGREGPIIQIGSSFGSTLGQILKMPPWQRITLVSAGAGAGIAATFNTPLGGVMFAAEIMMPEVSPRTFLPVVIATGAATYIGRLFFGVHPAFEVPPLQIADVRMIGAAALTSFVVLGVLCGLASWAFIRVLYWMETVFPKVPGNDYTRHAIGMALVGTMMYALMVFQGHYFIEGVGYATIQSILKENMTSIVLLAVLFVGKLLATTLSLGSGSSGGIFSPSLFMGATLGGAFGALMDMALPAAGVGVGEAAMVGMAAVVGGATGGAMTAIVMIFEMTRDYNIMVPAILAVAASLGVRRVLVRGEHLHHKAGAARQAAAEIPLCQHVLGALRPRGHEQGHRTLRGRDAADPGRSASWPARRKRRISSSATTSASSASFNGAACCRAWRACKPRRRWATLRARISCWCAIATSCTTS